MFNIKNIVNKITERGRDSQPNSPARPELDVLSKQAAEGFLCPKCMQALPSAEELQTHYVSFHNAGEENFPELPEAFDEVAERYCLQEHEGNADMTYSDSSIAVSDVGELQRMLAETQKSKMEIHKKNQKLEQRLAQLTQEYSCLKVLADEGKENQNALKERLKVVEAQLAHRESLDDAAVLRQELVQVQRVMDELTREKERERDDLKAQLQELKHIQAASKNTFTKDEEDAIKEKLTHLSFELKQNEEKVIELETALMKCREELAKADVKLQKEQESTHKLQDSLSKQKMKTDDALKELKAVKDDCSKVIKESEEIGRLQLQALQEKQERVLNVEEEMQAKFDAINKQKEILKSELMHKSKLHEDAEQQILIMRDKITSLEEKMQSIEKERQQFLKPITAKATDILESEALISLRQEKAQLIVQINELEKTHQNNIAVMQKNINETQEELKAFNILSQKQEELESDLTNQQLLIENLNDQLCKQSAELNKTMLLECKLHEENKLLKDRVEEMTTERDLLNKECDDKVTKTEAALSDTREALLEKERIIQDVNSVINGYQKEMLKCSEREKYYKDLYEQTESIVIDKNEKLFNQTEECERLRNELSQKENEFKVQADGFEEMILSNSDYILSLESLKQEMEWKMKEMKETIKQKEAELKDVSEARMILMTERLELISKVSKLEENAGDLERQLSSISLTKKAIESELEIQKKNTEELEAQLEELKTTLGVQLEMKNQEYKEIQSDLDEVTGEKFALEAQLVTSQNEQQALLEKCYASSAENENLRKSISELRRKREESEAALHELGRENQTLQLELEKLLGRKWTEDSDANNCTLCTKEFNLLVRKHHCRNCGQIFCSECSSKMAPIASNKKAVRVCESCYNELSSK